MSGEAVSRYGSSDAMTASLVRLVTAVSSGGAMRRRVPPACVIRTPSCALVRPYARLRSRSTRARDSGHQCGGIAAPSPKVR